MGTVADKLAFLQEVKEGIKYAIISMGVDVGDDTPFFDYADLIMSIEPDAELPSGVYTITVETGSAEKGSVSQGGYASRGMLVTVEAAPNAGYRFANWYKYAGKSTIPTLVTAQTHTFEVSGNTRFVANFTAE